MGRVVSVGLAGLTLALVLSALAGARGVAVFRSEARADATSELSRVSLPVGAERTAGDPSVSSSLGRRPWYHVGGAGARYVALRPYVVDDRGFWRRSGNP